MPWTAGLRNTLIEAFGLEEFRMNLKEEDVAWNSWVRPLGSTAGEKVI